MGDAAFAQPPYFDSQDARGQDLWLEQSRYEHPATGYLF